MLRPCPPGVLRAVDWMEERFAQSVCLQELAAVAGLSQSHFARSFQRAIGCTPYQYLLRVRLSRARQLMVQQNSVMTLAEIAFVCGFFDQAHLGRHFQQAFGMTPTAFRRSRGGLEL
jgi:AraC family transcriptional regulator